MSDLNFKETQLKRNLTLPEHSFNESGYSSFQGAQSLHNSTIDESDSENCQNVSNTVQKQQSFKSVFSRHSALSGAVTSNTVTPQSILQAFSSKSNDSFMHLDSRSIISSPLSNQIQSATKRRKHHHKQTKTCPKRSKKRLNFLGNHEDEPKRRVRYFNGEEQIDIIGMLDTLPVMELIFKQLDDCTLDVMTQVSRRWQQAVHNSKSSMERLHRYKRKKSLTKENFVEVKATRKSYVHTSNTQPLRSINTRSSTMMHSMLNSNPTDSQDATKDSLFVEHMRRVKCPRCGKISKTFHVRNMDVPPVHNITSSLSNTLPIFTPFNVEAARKPLSRFNSTDTMLTFCSNMEDEATLAECTAAACRFRFCLHCFCSYHPGENCRVTEMGTPSKIVILPKENTTPPKCIQKHDSKLSRKKSLKRLCF